MNLGPPESHHLRAATGWLELGNPAEAGEEIARMRPEFLNHPEVLELRWEVCAAGRAWPGALEVAETLVSIAPERLAGWVQRAYALRRVTQGGLEAAFASLHPAVEKFPQAEVVPYNLACYAAQLGRLNEAEDWLQRACRALGQARAIKAQALLDEDLQPLWEKIRAW